MSDEKEVKILDDEKDLVIQGHDYDGIKELNNPLPMWWLIVFAGTIIFSVVYYAYYHHMGGPSNLESMNEVLDEMKASQAEVAEKGGGLDLEELNAFIATDEAKAMGAEAYKTNCAACHGQKGEGGIGPNLTDNYWINGDGKSEALYVSIDKGVTDKGMPAWGAMLGKDKVMALVGFVASLKGTNPENAKAPQGKEITE